MASLREWLDSAIRPRPRAGPTNADEDEVAERERKEKEEGKSLLLPPCNAFLRRALYESIGEEYPSLILEKADGNRIRVLRLNDEEKAEARRMVDSFDPSESIPSKRFFWFSVGALGMFIACLAGQSALPFGLEKLEMGFVALFFAGAVLLAYRNEVDKFYSAVDWDLLAFFASLFVVIHVMEHAQVLNVIGKGIASLLELKSPFNSVVLLSSSAVASSVTDNIPLAAMLAQILGNLGTAQDSPFWWCVVFGANLGGNITPIGSASTVVAMTIIHRQKLNLTFGGFVKAAVPFAAVQIAIATVYVLIFL